MDETHPTATLQTTHLKKGLLAEPPSVQSWRSLLPCLQQSQGQPANITLPCTCCLQARQCRAHQALTSSKIKERLQQRNTASFRFLFGSLSVSCTKTSRERLNGSCRCGMFNVMYEKTLLIWKRSDMGRSKVFNAVELQMCQAFGTVDRSTAFSPASMLPAVEFQH